MYGRRHWISCAGYATHRFVARGYRGEEKSPFDLSVAPHNKSNKKQKTMGLSEKELWRLAKKRADFKKSLYSYFAVIPFLWAIWWFTIGRYAGFGAHTWPIYATLGWGLGLVISYYEAYKAPGLKEKEYHKLAARHGDSLELRNLQEEKERDSLRRETGYDTNDFV